jgi:hypothetical protein
MDAVGRERPLLQARPGAETCDEAGKVATEQRLAPGQPHPRHAFPDEHADKAIDLLEGQEIGARQPHVLRLGHAVQAAQVAAVRHRHAQRPQRPVERIEHGHRSDYGIHVRRPPGEGRRTRARLTDSPSVLQEPVPSGDGSKPTQTFDSRRIGRVGRPRRPHPGRVAGGSELIVSADFCRISTGLSTVLASPAVMAVICKSILA